MIHHSTLKWREKKLMKKHLLQEETKEKKEKMFDNIH